MTRFSPRVLDASAITLLFAGHPTLMRLLDDAEAESVLLIMPTVAIAEAQVALDAAHSMWEFFFRFRGIRMMELTEDAAVEIGKIARSVPATPSTQVAGRLAIAQAVYGSRMMLAPIFTSVPDAYTGFDVVVTALLIGD